MTFTYTWINADKTTLKREDEDGNVLYVPVDPGNTDYAAFQSSGATADDYVEPLAPPTLTAEEKLESIGLTIEELKELLDI